MTLRERIATGFGLTGTIIGFIVGGAVGDTTNPQALDRVVDVVSAPAELESICLRGFDPESPIAKAPDGFNYTACTAGDVITRINDNGTVSKFNTKTGEFLR